MYFTLLVKLQQQHIGRGLHVPAVVEHGLQAEFLQAAGPQ